MFPTTDRITIRLIVVTESWQKQMYPTVEEMIFRKEGALSFKTLKYCKNAKNN